MIPPIRKRATLFADGKKGMTMQVYELEPIQPGSISAEHPLGEMLPGPVITLTASRKTRDDVFVEHYLIMDPDGDDILHEGNDYDEAVMFWMRRFAPEILELPESDR